MNGNPPLSTRRMEELTRKYNAMTEGLLRKEHLGEEVAEAHRPQQTPSDIKAVTAAEARRQRRRNRNRDLSPTYTPPSAIPPKPKRVRKPKATPAIASSEPAEMATAVLAAP